MKTNRLCDCCAKNNQKIDSDSLKGEKQSGDRAASQQVGKNSKKTIKTNGLCDCCAQQCVLGGRTLG